MILFDPTLENFVDGVDFSANDCCTWVVYPPGCAGDLLASILNFHYVQTGAKFKGITEKGQIIFRPSDMKYTNQLQYLQQVNDKIFNDQFFFKIADCLSTQHLNWSKMDHFIFSNHWVSDRYVNLVLKSFSNAKIIKLLPQTIGEASVTRWLGNYKNEPNYNRPFLIPMNADQPLPDVCNVCDDRILTIYFGDFINKKKFNSVYQQIQKHQGFCGSLITYDFIQFWLGKQHTSAKDYLLDIAER